MNGRVTNPKVLKAAESLQFTIPASSKRVEASVSDLSLDGVPRLASPDPVIEVN